MDTSLLFAVFAFLTLMLGGGFAAYHWGYKPGRALRQLGNPVITGSVQGLIQDPSEPQASTIVTVLHQIGSYIPTSESEMNTLRAQLVRAGFRSENAVPVFYGIRLTTVVLMFLVTLVLQNKAGDNAAMRIALLGFGCVVGWILPKMMLEKRVAKRQLNLRLSLPDALDLLVVSVEAGLGLDQAIQHVARELQVSHPQLSEDMSMVTLEMRAGKRRSDALRNFAERTGEPEIQKLVAILIQNDRFGTSMGESLRTHSDFLRNRRRQEAEERAGKVGVKLVFPIFFFILPSMLIVAAGPGILQIFKYLFPMMKHIG